MTADDTRRVAEKGISPYVKEMRTWSIIKCNGTGGQKNMRVKWLHIKNCVQGNGFKRP
jgi:hypothetical protein